MHKNYYIDKLENNRITLVKVLNEYPTIEEAKNDLFKLLANEKTEKEILKEYSKKNIL